MPTTPDRHPGPLIEDDEIQLKDAGSDPTLDGAVRFVSGAFRFKDGVGVFDPRTGGSGLTPATHRPLDQLVHDLAESGYEEVIYTGNKVTSIVTWATAAKLLKVREVVISYSGAQITNIQTLQYDGSGVQVEELNEVPTYSGGQITAITRTLT